MADMVLDLEKYSECARRIVAEGQVLLRDRKSVV